MIRSLPDIILHRLSPYGVIFVAAVAVMLLGCALRFKDLRLLAQNVSSSGSMTYGSNIQSTNNGPLTTSNSPVAEGNLLQGNQNSDARSQAPDTAFAPLLLAPGRSMLPLGIGQTNGLGNGGLFNGPLGYGYNGFGGMLQANTFGSGAGFGPTVAGFNGQGFGTPAVNPDNFFGNGNALFSANTGATAYGANPFGVNWTLIPNNGSMLGPSILTSLFGPPSGPAIAVNPSGAMPMSSTAVGTEESGVSAMWQQDYAQRDQELRRQMRAVTSWLQNYCVSNHRFPPFGDELVWTEGQLNLLVADNPYEVGSLQTPVSYVAAGVPGSPETSTPSANYTQYGRVRLINDTTLNGELINEYAQQPPDSWVADPGTIVAIGNEADTFIVWGAGIDGRPIRDSLTGGVLIDVGHWGFIH